MLVMFIKDMMLRCLLDLFSKKCVEKYEYFNKRH